MIGTSRLSRGLFGVAILAAAEFACVAAIEFAAIGPAEAQFFGSFSDRPRPPPRRGGFFDGLFGPSTRNPVYQEPPIERSQPVESSRAPAPRKADKDAVAPTTSVVVLGDGMADWLAYGLEEAFADAPEIGIVRRNKLLSGLLRYEARSDLDWWHVARDLLSREKPNYVVMMLGVGDRQNIRERDLVKAKDADKKDQADQPGADPNAPKDQADEPDQSIVAPEPQPGRRANGVIEFRTDQWAAIYSKRIDDTIAALKSKGVPVFWVGLPSIRGPKSTADAVYLNDLYRARAERAGAVYIDVWDGFVDEGGKFTTFGPDFEGQRRRLRAGDGVYFSPAGARKLAHYVERELRRYMSNRGPIALPSGPMGPVPADGKSAVRPLAGPVVPLTLTPDNSDVLLGGSGASPAQADTTASRVLVKGEPMAAPSGRADDFVWPPGSVAKSAPPVAAAPDAAAPSASMAAPAAVPVTPAPAAATSYTEPPLAIAKPAEPPKAKPAPAEPAKPRVVQRAVETRPRAPAPQQANPPRPPQPVRPGPFDWFR